MGQWAHNYPDQPTTHLNAVSPGYDAEAYPEMTRMDWALDLFRWFEYWLKGNGVMRSYMFRCKDMMEDGTSRIRGRLKTCIGKNYRLTKQAAAQLVRLQVSQSIPASENDRFISGLPTLHLSASTGLCDGGQIFATMYDATENLRIGHATMDVRYRDGGYEANCSPLTTYNMQMEFNPMDVIVPAGNEIKSS